MLEDILNFPAAAATSGKSINEICTLLLIKYRRRFPSIDELTDGLSKDIGLIESWIKYSQDKRLTPSWYFIKAGEKYKIGYMNKDCSYNEGVYDDACFACATFIKLEIESRLLKQSVNFSSA